MTQYLDYSSIITSIPTSFASVSIGSSSTPLPSKLSAISSAGFQGIELGFPDLQAYASQLTGRQIANDDYDTLCTTATAVKKLATDLRLTIMLLQPFSNFEGWPRDSQERKDAFERAHGWIRIMLAAGCEKLQVGSSDSEGLDKDLIAADLADLADLLAQHGLRLAYENWCWSTHAPHWHDVWTLSQKAARPNMGLCLDTFQSAGGEWGDPTTSSGRIESLSASDLEARYAASLESLTTTLPADKIYLLQISDAYKLSKPLDPDPDEDGLRPRGRWSHDWRPLPFHGDGGGSGGGGGGGAGYLPIVPFTRAVLRTGFRGWFSVEVFDAQADSERDLEGYAKSAMESVRRLVREACDSSTSSAPASASSPSVATVAAASAASAASA